MNAGEKVRIIVVFGDISGFSAFCDAITNDTVEYDPFMAEYDRLVGSTFRGTDYVFNETGDGFMVTMALPDHGTDQMVCEVFLRLWRLLKKIEALIARKDPPRPGGFRIAGAAGYVKRSVRDGGEIVLRGKHINHAHKLLDVARGKGFVCDDSLRFLVPDRLAKRHAMRFSKLNEHTWMLTIGKRRDK